MRSQHSVTWSPEPDGSFETVVTQPSKYPSKVRRPDAFVARMSGCMGISSPGPSFLPPSTFGSQQLSTKSSSTTAHFGTNKRGNNSQFISKRHLIYGRTSPGPANYDQSNCTIFEKRASPEPEKHALYHSASAKFGPPRYGDVVGREKPRVFKDNSGNSFYGGQRSSMLSTTQTLKHTENFSSQGESFNSRLSNNTGLVSPGPAYNSHESSFGPQLTRKQEPGSKMLTEPRCQLNPPRFYSEKMINKGFGTPEPSITYSSFNKAPFSTLSGTTKRKLPPRGLPERTEPVVNVAEFAWPS